MLKVIFVPFHDIQGASSRYRVYQYLVHLDRYAILPIVLRIPLENRIAKIVGLLKVLWTAGQVDVVFIQKRLFSHKALYLIQRANDRIVYDFDDAIYSAFAPSEPSFSAIKKTRQLLAAMLSQAKCIVAGNQYLANYAQEYNDRVTILPTAIDTDKLVPIGQPGGDTTVLGWIGNPENLVYLNLLENVFTSLGAKYGKKTILRIVCSKPYSSQSSLMVDNRQWRLHTEFDDLRSFDIGLSPLVDNEWTRGKCGFRALQYMAAGVPTVVSPVGVNRDIVNDGENGFLAETQEQWFAKLSRLIEDKELRSRLAERGRSTVEREYSLTATLPRLVATLQEVSDS